MDDTVQLTDGGFTKNVARSGRRARQSSEMTAAEDTNQRKSSSSVSSASEGPPPKPARRQGGWAEESTGTGSAKSARRFAAEELEDQRLRPQTPEGSDDEGDIPVIPDLEEVQEEDLSMQIAAPPSIQVNRVMTYRDLDMDLMKYSAFQTLKSFSRSENQNMKKVIHQVLMCRIAACHRWGCSVRRICRNRTGSGPPHPAPLTHRVKPPARFLI
ncbi:intraflagellar transport protein 43 homolog isoform X1 [Triplophysa dalaica]|uniref:intraflagellar transport protein 43 homolog isoform X1 n=1 Tax=Triplophysa dalaica TaxID=1582913 RepID=UPI0024DF5F52|nr:intraflagellar transport protein 43 homolog isoform X1 [Triplophysa dalaica]